MTHHEINEQTLWRRRFERYITESKGYWRYAARSNFFGLVLVLVIISSYYYAKMLQRLPTDYPYIWIALLLLVPLLASSPIRTLLRHADRMFLLPMEHRMGAYFRSAFLYSFVIQGFWTFIAWIALYPLYRHCVGGAEQPLPLMLGFLLLVKIANLAAAWQESRFVDQRVRLASTLFRWSAVTTVVCLQFLYHVLWASGTALVLTLGWLAAVQLTSKYLIGWDYLIAKEKQQQARLYTFFSWFADVPQLPTRITRRSWIGGVAKWIPFKQDSVYMYVYTKTLLRTELFTIVLRMTLLGALAISVISSGGARATVLLIVLLISTVQLSALENVHRYTFWLKMYPLNHSLKPGSLAWLIWCVLLAQTCVLAIPLLIRSSPVYAFAPVAALLMISSICRFWLRRKFKAAASLEA